MATRTRDLLVAAATGLLAAAAHAVGGHFAVDDAEILAPGNCKLEGWFTRSPGDTRLAHTGSGCRVGPVELTVSGEYERVPGDSQTDWALSGKWAGQVAEGLSLGALLEPGWQAGGRPRYQGSSARILLSWQALPQVALHANVGRDFVRGPGDEPRHGVALVWKVAESWSVVGERYREEGGQFARAGLKWEPTQDWQLAFSRAQRLSGPGASAWTLALTREIGLR